MPRYIDAGLRYSTRLIGAINVAALNVTECDRCIGILALNIFRLAAVGAAAAAADAATATADAAATTATTAATTAAKTAAAAVAAAIMLILNCHITSPAQEITRNVTLNTP